MGLSRGIRDPPSLVTDLAYLTHRCFRDGPYATESDLRHAADLYPDDPAVDWLARLFTQHGHTFASLSTVADLAATLWSRTEHAPAELSRTPLQPLLPKFYLEPRWGLREAPPALKRVLEGHTGRVLGVAFSPDGTLLATASYDGTVALWEPDRRAMVSQLALGTPVLALAWHAGELAVGTAAGDVVLLAVVDRDPGGRASCAHNGPR